MFEMFGGSLFDVPRSTRVIGRGLRNGIGKGKRTPYFSKTSRLLCPGRARGFSTCLMPEFWEEDQQVSFKWGLFVDIKCTTLSTCKEHPKLRHDR